MRAIGSRFPKFRERIHVVEPQAIPTAGTRYHFVDPASSRNWYMIWVLVDPKGRHWVYREWPAEGIYIPGLGDPAAWAETVISKRSGGWKRGVIAKGTKSRVLKRSWNAGWIRVSGTRPLRRQTR